MSMRIGPIKPATSPHLKRFEERIISRRGRISLLYGVLLNRPELALGWEELLYAIRHRSSLEAIHREFIILRVAVLNNADYEFEVHRPLALKAGLTPQVLDEIRKRNVDLTATKLTDDQRLLLQLTDSSTNDIKIKDELYEKLVERFSEKTVLDLVVTVAAYNMVSRVIVALKIAPNFDY